MSFFDELKQGITDVSKTVYVKSEEVVGVAKLKVKKNSLSSELDDVYVELGKLVYEKQAAGEEYPQEIVELCQKIALGLEAIDEVDKKIDKVKEDSKEKRDTSKAADIVNPGEEGDTIDTPCNDLTEPELEPESEPVEGETCDEPETVEETVGVETEEPAPVEDVKEDIPTE